MLRRSLVFGSLTGLPALLRGQPDAQNSLAITNVTVIDATGAPERRNSTVIIRSGRIAAIGATPATPVDKGTPVLSGLDKYLIPGLWDAHVHSLWDAERPKLFFPLFLANGVTTVREMGGPMAASEQVNWRERVAKREVLGPDLIVCGPFVDGPRAIWPGSILVSDEVEARKAVEYLQRVGVQFIKVYSQVPRPAYFALADEAKKHGIPFAGHVPLLIDVAEASNAGQRSLEHLMGVLLGTSSRGSELKEQLLAGANLNQLNDAMVESHDDRSATALFDQFIRNGTWQVPTLTIRHARPFLAELAASNDSRLQYLPKSIVGGWTSRDDPRQPGTAAIIESRKRLYRKELELVGAMHRQGVRIAAGTDTPNPFCFPGFSIHNELALLVEAGLSPMQALQAATRNPAVMTGLEAELGTIEKGKHANLVLLEANPLTNIRNTQKIASVILHGRLLAKSDLNDLLTQAAALAQRTG